MPVREDLGGALLECLKDVTSLLEHAHSAALRQQDALVSSDAEAIALACASQEEILRRIAQADERAAAVAARITEEAGLDASTANAEAIGAAAGAPHGDAIARELKRVPKVAQRVRDANDVNCRLITSGLDVITSCLRIVVREPEPAVYSRYASLAGVGSGVLSLDSRV
jgi:hypothetical protein